MIDLARKISDRQYQLQSWFGEGSRISSPEELYCGLVDDYLFGEFLLDNNLALTEAQHQTGTLLKQTLENYFEKISDTPDPHDIIDDPEWDRVRQSAKEFVLAMQACD